MHRVQAFDALSTVAGIAETVYNLVDPVAGVEDPDRAERARAVLRRVNPWLPDRDDDRIGQDSFVYLPRIVAVPFRVPPMPAAVRDALAGLAPAIRNAETLAVADTKGILKQDGNIDTSDLDRLQRLCQLMRIPGVSPATAAYLHDDRAGAWTSVEGVADADIAGFQAALDNPRLAPKEWLDRRPWSYIRTKARLMVGRSTTLPVRYNSSPVRGSAIDEDAQRWNERAADMSRTAEGRASAEAIRDLRTIQSLWLRGNRALDRGRGRAAVRHYTRFLEVLGELTLQEGLHTSTQEVKGPSVESVIQYAGLLLDRVREDDVERAREGLGVAQTGRSKLVREIAFTDLQATKQKDLEGGTKEAPLHVLGDRLGKAWAERLSMEVRGDLEAANQVLTADLDTTNAHGRATDFLHRDHALLRLNARSQSFGPLRGGFAQAWSEVKERFVLRDVRPVVDFRSSGWEEKDWVPGVALTPEALEKHGLNASGQSQIKKEMTVFDAFARFTPSQLPTGFQPILLPLNDNFASAYRLRMLSTWAASDDGLVRNATAEDFADPSRFALLLPALYATSFLQNFAAAHELLGATKKAAIVRQCVQVQKGIDYKNQLTSPLQEVFRAQQNAIEVPNVNAMEGPEFLAELRALNRAGDQLYKQENLSGAREVYAQARWYCNLRSDMSERAGMVGDAFDLLSLQVRRRTRLSAEGEPLGTARRPTLLTLLVLDRGLDYSHEEPFISGVDRGRLPQALTKSSWAFAGLEAPYVTYDQVIEPDHEPGGISTDHLDYEWPTEYRTDREIPGGFEPPEAGTITVPRTPGTCPPGFPPGETVLPLDVDAAFLELIYSEHRIRQIDAGLNWLGMDGNAVPAWRFETLLHQARYFVEKADSFQQRALALLQALEAEQIGEWQAEAAIAVAQEGVEVAKAQVGVASAQVSAANAQHEAATFSKNSALAHGAFSAIGAVGSVIAGAAFPPLGVGLAVVGAAGSVARAVSSGGRAVMEAKVAQANVEVAEAQEVVAEAQLDMAQLQLTQAEGFLTLLQSQVLTSESYNVLLDYVGNIALSYLEMGTRLAWMAERAYNWERRTALNLIQMSYDAPDSIQGRFAGAATLLSHLDTLAHERAASQTERHQLLKCTISLSVEDPAALLQLRATGMTRIFLPLKRLDAMFPGLYLHSLKRVEVEFDGLLPAGGPRAILSTAGIGYVRVPYTPAYLQGVPVEALEHDWAYPSSEYSLDGERLAPYLMKPLNARSVSQMLSEYRRAQDSIVLGPAEGALDAFEHLPVDLNWVLRLPASGNDFDLNHIADVRLVLYFTALYDPMLEVQQQDALKAEPASENQYGSMFLASVLAPQEMERVRRAPSDVSLRDHRVLRIPVTGADLRSNLTERNLSNITATILGLEAVEARLKLRVAHTYAPFGVVITTATDAEPTHGEAEWGTLYSGVGDEEVRIDPDDPDTKVRSGRGGDFPDLHELVQDLVPSSPPVPETDDETAIGAWTFKVLEILDAEDAPQNAWLRDEDGQVVEVDTGKLVLPTDASAVFDGGSWLNARAVARVGLDASAADESFLELALRDGDHRVTARFGSANDAQGELRLTVDLEFAGVSTRVQEPDGEYAVVRDAVYELELVVLGTRALVFLDKQLMIDTELTYTSGQPQPGTVSFHRAGTGAHEVFDVVVERLRHDGTILEEVVHETFETVDAWTLSGGASRQEDSHQIHDLSFIREVVLQVDHFGKVGSA